MSKREYDHRLKIVPPAAGKARVMPFRALLCCCVVVLSACVQDAPEVETPPVEEEGSAEKEDAVARLFSYIPAPQSRFDDNSPPEYFAASLAPPLPIPSPRPRPLRVHDVPVHDIPFPRPRPRLDAKALVAAAPPPPESEPVPVHDIPVHDIPFPRPRPRLDAKALVAAAEPPPESEPVPARPSDPKPSVRTAARSTLELPLAEDPPSGLGPPSPPVPLSSILPDSGGDLSKAILNLRTEIVKHLRAKPETVAHLHAIVHQPLSSSEQEILTQGAQLHRALHQIPGLTGRVYYKISYQAQPGEDGRLDIWVRDRRAPDPSAAAAQAPNPAREPK